MGYKRYRIGIAYHSMKIGFYNPYFDSLSGGERYVFSVASHWSHVHDVSIFWNDPDITHQAQKRFHIDLSRVHTAENVFASRNIFRKLRVSRDFDLIFFLSDGSIPTTFARYNILHFQIPFGKISVFPVKLSRFQAIVCNSKFTKKFIDPRLGKRAAVIYPPVPSVGQSGKKNNVILSVGRFHPLKKQDVLIRAISSIPGFTLVLAGGLLPQDEPYFKNLKELASKLPVRLYPNVSYEKLVSLYRESLVYWHAAGYGESKPEQAEHFGITTVEAMSAGCIPVVYNGGGQPEIVTEGKNGFLWKTEAELIADTRKAIEKREMSSDAQERAKKFSESRFNREFDRLLDAILA